MNGMQTIPIAVVNGTTDLLDDDVAAGVAALQRQVREHFAPAWRIDAQLTPARASQRDEAAGRRHQDQWALVLVDDEASADTLGYHDLTADGRPMARVLVRRALAAGRDWTHPASHELLEMLVDPCLDQAVYGCVADVPRFLALEVCDPCSAYEDSYDLQRRRVSDFLLPAWFHQAPCAGSRGPELGRLDWRDRARRPQEVLPGGSIAVFDGGGTDWAVLGADGRTSPPPAEDRSRNRRSSARARWRYSDMDWTP